MDDIYLFTPTNYGYGFSLPGSFIEVQFILVHSEKSNLQIMDTEAINNMDKVIVDHIVRRDQRYRVMAEESMTKQYCILYCIREK